MVVGGGGRSPPRRGGGFFFLLLEDKWLISTGRAWLPSSPSGSGCPFFFFLLSRAEVQDPISPPPPPPQPWRRGEGSSEKLPAQTAASALPDQEASRKPELMCSSPSSELTAARNSIRTVIYVYMLNAFRFSTQRSNFTTLHRFRQSKWTCLEFIISSNYFFCPSLCAAQKIRLTAA